MNDKKGPEARIPIFNLQIHHSKVEVPSHFDLKDLARKYLVFPLRMISQNGTKKLLLAMVNPFDHKAIADVEFRSGVSVLPVQADRIDIHWLIQTHYFGRKMSPVASVHEASVTHDLFTQLEMTTDEQKRPEWAKDGLQVFDMKNASE